MGNVFKKRRPQKVNVSSKDKAILDLKNARDRLKKYQNRLEKDQLILHGQAVALVQKKKPDRAKLLLQLKKVKEKQMKRANGQLLKVMEMVESVEWESQQLQIFEGLKAGNAVLDAIHTEMSIDAVEALMEDTQEAQDMANSIAHALGGAMMDMDDEAVMEEYAALENEAAIHVEDVLPVVPTEVNTTTSIEDALPRVPQDSILVTEIAAKKTKEPESENNKVKYESISI